MAEQVEGFQYEEIMDDLIKVCKTPEVCGSCAGKECLIGYSKYVTAKCQEANAKGLPGGMDAIPPFDIRGGYDEYDILHTISHLLLQCHTCKENHHDICILNIVRACMELIEFGDLQEFEGNPLMYMMKLRNVNAEKADVIAEEYNRAKNQM